MLSTLRRRIAGASLALALPALAACGFQTDQVYQPAVGVNDRSGEVDVLGALVVSAAPGSGVFITSLVNNDTTRADKLVSVQGSGVQVAVGATPDIPVGGLVNFADKSLGGIPVQGAKVQAGGYITVRLTFQNADPVTIEVPVVTDTGPYAGLAGSASPTSPSLTQSASPSASPSSSPSSSSSASPSSAASSATPGG